jgi:hypothetical protein
MHVPAILLVAATAFVTDGVPSGLSSLLVVRADAAVAAIDPVTDDRRLISLPSLLYALTVRPTCATGMHAEAMSVSIADTRKTYSRDEIGQQPLIEISLSIPQQQIGPISIQTFCRAGQAGEDGRVLHIKGALTAHLSLRCADEDARSIVYASQPLDIALECRKHDETHPSGDQDASSPAPR